MKQVNAIFRHGIFEPLEPVGLAEGQRVRIYIVNDEPISKEAALVWLARVQARQAAIREREGTGFDSTASIAEDRLR